MSGITLSTFGVNVKPLTVGNPVLFGRSGGATVATVLRVSTTGITRLMFLDGDADIPGQVYELPGHADIPQDTNATGPDDLAIAHWCLTKVPPVMG